MDTLMTPAIFTQHKNLQQSRTAHLLAVEMVQVGCAWNVCAWPMELLRMLVVDI